jgi:hypothetical protein
MDLRHFRHLCAVVESASLGRASVVLGISEPALSKSVRALDDRLGVRLLDRGPKGMVPTASGHALYARARAILAEVEHATIEIAGLPGLSKGVVRVGVLPRAIAPLQASRAAVRVIAQIGTTDLLERETEPLQLAREPVVRRHDRVEAKCRLRMSRYGAEEHDQERQSCCDAAHGTLPPVSRCLFAPLFLFANGCASGLVETSGNGRLWGAASGVCAAGSSCHLAGRLYDALVSLVWFGLLSLLVIERRAQMPAPLR